MDYRDERDALRARVESLESSLASAQAELQRMRATEAALEASRREAMRLRFELERFRPAGAARESSKVGLVIGGGLAVMTMAFGAAFLLRTKPASPPKVGDFGPSSQPDIPVEPPRVPPRVVEPPHGPTVATTYMRSAQVEWPARVLRSQGGAPAVGTACKVLAELRGDGLVAIIGDLEVRCGTTVLYRSSDEINGVSTTSVDVIEVAGKTPDSMREALTYSDVGSRTGRNQFTLSTLQREGTVWSENAPAFRVELQVDSWTVDRQGQPLVDPANRRERLLSPIGVSGAVRSLEGEVQVTQGQACTVDVTPASGESNCRVRVRCGSTLLYGAGDSGYNKCTIENGKVGKLVDPRPSAEDTDPMLEMDLSENVVTVRDSGEKPWSVSITLQRPQ